MFKKSKFDWFQNFPIFNTTNNIHLTPNGLKMLEFIKLPLSSFYPGLVQQTSSHKTKKTSFNILLKELAQQRPCFVMDQIRETNPNLLTETIIPFTIVLETLKNLLHSFTTLLFNQTDYRKFFQSQHFSTLPSIKH